VPSVIPAALGHHRIVQAPALAKETTQSPSKATKQQRFSPGDLGVPQARAAARSRIVKTPALARENTQSLSKSSKQQFPSCVNWHPLATPATWCGSEDDALSLPEGTAFASLPPPWKVLLLSDGSVTRHLHIMTGKPVAVDLLEMGRIDNERERESFSSSSSEDGDESDSSTSNSSIAIGLPSGAELLHGPLVQRRVLLRADAGKGDALVYAASWWNERDAAAALDGKTKTSSSSSSAPSPSRSQPIWTSLASSRTELFREIRTLYRGGCPALEKELGAKKGEEMWGRHYLFWSNGKPLTVIYEVFSPRLERWLGK